LIKLYRFDYSPFVRKVQIVLDLLGAEYEAVDVPYGDRSELADLTGGYIQVPVLVADGEVITDSRNICRWLVSRDPSPTPLCTASS
jgi:glutathione S-transferase